MRNSYQNLTTLLSNLKQKNKSVREETYQNLVREAALSSTIELVDEENIVYDAKPSKNKKRKKKRKQQQKEQQQQLLLNIRLKKFEETLNSLEQNTRSTDIQPDGMDQTLNEAEELANYYCDALNIEVEDTDIKEELDQKEQEEQDQSMKFLLEKYRNRDKVLCSRLMFELGEEIEAKYL